MTRFKLLYLVFLQIIEDTLKNEDSSILHPVYQPKGGLLSVNFVIRAFLLLCCFISWVIVEHGISTVAMSRHDYGCVVCTMFFMFHS